jgi:hypothetical protein
MPSFVNQPLSPVAIHTQGLHLAARAVQRQHELPAKPLRQRVLRDQSLQLANQHAVPSQLQVGVDALLYRADPKVFQASDFRRRERLLDEVGQRRTAPQGQRGSEFFRRNHRPRRIRRRSARNGHRILK